ncbi:hypothetical protein D8674_022786 [Pyrus ussuriensis x Pyrus communis]|uniref:Uncharacterized protein n=1 Tax=Pyrus ussuriensis x Pyrus communis TaxID=2448454 RepID=A0A5N5GLH4_9ROSA|nr:hypothetical protein D8674_022786 [Pyrus ussuriensis x Pyrus communis]
MEHDHIDHLMVPNNVEGVVDERHLMTCRAQAPNGTKELMKFNDKGHPVEPPHTIARFSSKPNCITFFTLTHTRKSGEPVDARSIEIIGDFNRKLKLYEDRNEIVTDEVRHIVYANVLGPERATVLEGLGHVDLGWRQVREVLAQLRKKHIDSMVAHKRRLDLKVETMKREMRAEIMFVLKNADGDMIGPNGVDVIQNIGMDDEIGYHPCMMNVTGISK